MVKPNLTAADGDLVVVTLPGVQRFISEARSTADVRAGSEIVARLAAGAAEACAVAGGALVFPSALAPGTEAGRAGQDESNFVAGMPNRVVAVAPEGTGPDVGRRVAAEVARLWDGWVRRALKLSEHGVATPATPGFPVVHWVCVSAGAGGYPAQWDRARELLEARRRVRDFGEAATWTRRDLCMLSPRWPAEPLPPGLREHEKDRLCAANWVKRRWRQMQGLDGFPSTSSVASALYRRAVIGQLSDSEVRAGVRALISAVHGLSDAAGQVMDIPETPVAALENVGDQAGRWLAASGGPWVYPGMWQEATLARLAGVQADNVQRAVAAGALAARRLMEIMKQRHGVPAPPSYLAVIVQDLDGMGRFLSGQGPSADGERITVTVDDHQEISGRLRSLATAQTQLLRRPEFLGVPIYAGGDDLLAFVPAGTALAAAQACHDEVPPGLPRASTAVLFFHYRAGLQSAMGQAKDMLKQAKAAVAGKHALAVGYWRRSGTGEFSIQPWTRPDGGSAAELFAIFAADQAHPLSPRLTADLERDGDELASLYRQDPDVYQAELLRLVRRHTGTSVRPDGDGSKVADANGGTVASAALRAAHALAWLGSTESAPGGRPGAGGPRPERAAQVAVFLRQEAR